MALLYQLISIVSQLIPHEISLIMLANLAILIYVLYQRKFSIYLLDYTCYKPPASLRVPFSMFAEHIVHENFDPDSLAFQFKILEKSGFSEETCVPLSVREMPIRKSHSIYLEEVTLVMFSIIEKLFLKHKINAKSVDILITNSCMFSPTPSLSSMVINRFKMRSNIMSFNLSGMGCSAGIISTALANDLLRVHRNSLALVVSSEILSPNWYTGKDRTMLLPNCLFKMGGAAMLLSSRKKDRKIAKYELKHIVRTHKADDKSYNCIIQDIDMEKKVGISISKSIVDVANNALKSNMGALGPLVLPYSEQLRYGFSLILHKMGVLEKKSLYMPNFRHAFDHFCFHAGGKSIIVAIRKGLNLSEENVEASKMTLHRFGNTSSSSIWYELSYTEAKGRMKKGDRVWQIAFGSGFKCNSVVWRCNRDIGEEKENPWSDRIGMYPVEVPDIVKIQENQ